MNDCIYILRISAGVIDHGSSKLFYLDLGECGKGGNLGCSVILNTLIRHVQTHGFLPPKLYVQSDNTTSDYKNCVTLWFLGYLVSRGIFEEVSLFYLLYISISTDTTALLMLLPHIRFIVQLCG